MLFIVQKENKQYNRNIRSLDSLENLFEIYEKKKDIDEIDNIKNELLELISTYKALNNENKMIFKVIGFYNVMDDKESIEGIVIMIIHLF